MNKLKLLIFLIFVLSSCKSIDQISFDQRELKRFNDDFGYVIFDIDANKVIAQNNADKKFIPASVFKLFTNFAALEVLGPDTRFNTRLYVQGKIINGHLDGNLILESDGDASFLIENLYNFAFAVKFKGINSISGKIYYYNSDFLDVKMINDDQPKYASYNPGFSSLNLNFNSFKITKDANQIISVPQNSATITRVFHNKYYLPQIKSDVWHINNKISERKLPVQNSSYFFASQLREVLNNVGVKTEKIESIGKLPNDVELIIEQSSKTIKEIVKDGLIYSNNLYSEVLLVQLAKKLGCEIQDIKSAATCLQNWYNTNYPMIGFKDAVFDNGSGLSESIEISPKSVIEFLKIVENKSYGNDYFPTLLPLSGVSGTLQDRFLDKSSQIFAKTGSMDYISSVAGYYYGKDKELYICVYF